MLYQQLPFKLPFVAIDFDEVRAGGEVVGRDREHIADDGLFENALSAHVPHFDSRILSEVFCPIYIHLLVARVRIELGIEARLLGFEANHRHGAHGVTVLNVRRLV